MGLDAGVVEISVAVPLVVCDTEVVDSGAVEETADELPKGVVEAIADPVCGSVEELVKR